MELSNSLILVYGLDYTRSRNGYYLRHSKKPSNSIIIYDTGIVSRTRVFMVINGRCKKYSINFEGRDDYCFIMFPDVDSADDLEICSGYHHDCDECKKKFEQRWLKMNPGSDPVDAWKEHIIVVIHYEF